MKFNFENSKVLIVDDNPANVDILIELLHGFDVNAVLDGQSALEAVAEDKPDLILLDINMPGMDGFEVCQRLKADKHTNDIPIIFLSASNEDESIIKGFELGGVDYITKPYRASELITRIKSHLSLRYAMKLLDKLANVDEMTGISNRRRFYQRAESMMQQAKAKNVPLYLFVADIDKMKTINDTFGHGAGDLVIKTFAATAKKTLPPKTCFARFGSDEFIFILAGMPREKALQIAENLRIMISNARPLQDKPLQITISVGMSEFQTQDSTLDQFIARANANVYKAKAQNRNCIIS